MAARMLPVPLQKTQAGKTHGEPQVSATNRIIQYLLGRHRVASHDVRKIEAAFGMSAQCAPSNKRAYHDCTALQDEGLLDTSSSSISNDACHCAAAEQELMAVFMSMVSFAFVTARYSTRNKAKQNKR